MDKRYKLNKQKCSICGKTIKKILTKSKEFNSYDFIKTEQGDVICKDCERKYHIISDHQYRGYGYKYSTEPRFTAMDRQSTLTFGVEIEVAGNIKNIQKIDSIAGIECSIGYDTSVEGAMFELSYAPGTYYWYLYESKLQAICSLLQKDPWTKDSDTIGTHIHVGNIDARLVRGYLQIEEEQNPLFWEIIRIIAERHLNEYCSPRFSKSHHDAISYSRWGTLEFRFFKGTYDFNKIMNRMKFLKQLVENASADGINWKSFKKETKNWMIEVAKNNKNLSEDHVKMVEKILKGESIILTLTEEAKKKIIEKSTNSDYDDEEEDEDEDERETWND